MNTIVNQLRESTIHARQTVPVSWAIPLEGKREEAGRFWAFFPTHTPTYAPGILNAPWKLNSDRNAIIPTDDGRRSSIPSAFAVMLPYSGKWITPFTPFTINRPWTGKRSG